MSVHFFKFKICTEYYPSRYLEKKYCFQTYHGGNFFRGEGFLFTLKFDLDFGFLSILNNIERPMFHIPLNSLV